MGGKLRLGKMVALGIHSSMIVMNLLSHVVHTVSMFVSLSRKVQSVALISLLALSKSA